MKICAAILCFVAAVQAGTVLLPAATTLIRSPSDDSAIVQSTRIGGAFAYSTLEGHAYKTLTPIIQPAVYTTKIDATPLVYSYPALAPLSLAAPQPLVYTAGQPLLSFPGNTILLKPGDREEKKLDDEKEEDKKDEKESVVVESA